jgi:hypothetical protein
MAVVLLVSLEVACLRIRPKIVELSFGKPSAGASDDEQTLRSIRKYGVLCTVDYHGDYDERLRWLNDYHTKKAAELAAPSRCSLFAAYTTSGEPLFGRNFDRLDETPVLARFAAPGKYVSFAFSPASEVYLGEVMGVPNPSQDQKNKFLYCLPFYSTDGINEKGLAVAIAGAPDRRVKHRENRRPIFVLLFIRRMLDDCQNVEEAARFAETVSPYDKTIDVISHHFLVADADGRWLVIDYPDGDLRLTSGRGKPEVRTNHFLEGVPAKDNNITSFTRYDKLREAMNSPKPITSDIDAMDLLRAVRNGTAWSVVYEPRSRQGLLAVRENYRILYRFGFPQGK